MAHGDENCGGCGQICSVADDCCECFSSQRLTDYASSGLGTCADFANNFATSGASNVSIVASCH